MAINPKTKQSDAKSRKMSVSNAVEKVEEEVDASKSPYEFYTDLIAQYDKGFKKWEGRAEKIIKRYRDDRAANANYNSKLNILWSNTKVLTPAVFARLPQPDVSRRFRDNDPIARVASMILERALDFEIENYPDYRETMGNVVQDFLLPGRGTAWVRYEPHFHMVPAEQPQGDGDDGLQITEDVENDAPTEVEEVEYECCPVDYVHWRDFGHSIARTWEEVSVIWRKAYLDREALIERFGEDLGKEIPLDSKPEDETRKGAKFTDAGKEAIIYELWNKEAGKVVWISKSLGKILDERDDPLGLKEFFPCPKPLYFDLTTDKLEPLPAFAQYQDQARQLDVLAERIDGLIDALRVRGVYDGSNAELARLMTEGENNNLLPVMNWQAFAEKNGMAGAFQLVDITPFAQALKECYASVDVVTQQIYQITGISDILRGQTDPNETLGAQIMKSNNANGRLKTMQDAAVQFATALLQIKAQIICKQYSPETILKISAAIQFEPADLELIPQAIELLKNEPTDNFRIDVVSDSMVYRDEQQEKADRMEFLGAVGGFMQKSLPLAQAAPEMVPLLMQMLKFGVTGFKVGKMIEGDIDRMADEYTKVVQSQVGQPKPPPEGVQIEQLKQQGAQAHAQMQGKLKMQEIQANVQAEQQRMQIDAQAKQAEAQAKMEIERHKQEMQAQENMQQQQMEHERAMAQMQADQQLELEKLRIQGEQEMEIARMNNATKVEVALIGAKSKLSSETGDVIPDNGSEEVKQSVQSIGEAIQTLVSMMAEAQSRPKTVIRDETGKIVGVH